MQQNEFRQHLVEQIIPFWNNLKDEEYGGFYGYVSSDGIVDRNSDKGIILNNRILWFYSNAYLMLGDVELLRNAEHAWNFLKKYGYDRLHGGVYWSVSYDGIPLDDIKHTYNQAFSVYALSSFYAASKNEEALNMAYKQFHLIEEVCQDKGGYLEALDWNFKLTSNEKLSENGVMAGRTMNTLLHVLEAYTELYRVDGNPTVGDAIRRILDRFLAEIYNPEKGICEVFFDMEYHTLIDLESYGHDIEASWLMDRACQVLQDEEYTNKTEDMRKKLACKVYENAYDHENGGIYNEREKDKVDRQKIWWVQAEAVIGFYNLYQKTGDETYRVASRKTWDYIRNQMIDPVSGEWFESRKADGSLDPAQGLVHSWKCPYHNGRMCMEMMTRISDEKE